MEIEGKEAAIDDGLISLGLLEPDELIDKFDMSGTELLLLVPLELMEIFKLVSLILIYHVG